ncbi:DNA methyltransferase [Clostridium botulinum]|uniref:DNA methyltransferase n=1 Tax=Clostridium botulinum TaxID=1491 RepID=UPI00196838B4|nr:DNA methyltransferase [Clostridium botulinum]MBN1063702.1 class I SAM-dependent DNA methyltransferase [Clostridium botulinum]
MIDSQQREASRQFYYTWKNRGNEKSDSQLFWSNLLRDVLVMDHIEERVQFEKTVIIDGQTKFIDVYIPESKVLIEQKSAGKDIEKTIKQSGGKELTPYQQAKRYSDNLPYDEKPRWIVISNFSEIRVYNMNTKQPEKSFIRILLKDIQSELHRLDFLIREEENIASKELEISIQAGDIVGLMYDALLEQYADKNCVDSLKSLNKLCVRIVFCLYAEDSGVFDNHLMFHDYMVQFEARNWRNALIDLFKVLDTKIEDRDPYINDDLAAFPYVNGGLFADENIEIPKITNDIRNLILEKGCSFDWSKISPTIFGAVFESTLNPETRRSGGMHYTSIENIHKVIDPLFLDDLKKELEDIKKIPVSRTKKDRIKKFQCKLASLKFLDPACGSGNFLTETYTSLRKLENEVILTLTEGQILLGEVINPIQVSIKQFYGIEINDFAVTVAKTALWIAEHQMMKETEDIIHMQIDFLPLKTNATIIEGNALQINWENVVPKYELNYIMGNPPFVGFTYMTDNQKKDMEVLFPKVKNLDFVCAWYKKSNDYIKNSKIECGFVSTNSIVQGETVARMWEFIDYKINFAYRTFIWDSEVSNKAHVHCVIIGFSNIDRKEKWIYQDNNKIKVTNINPYLIDAPNIVVKSNNKPICINVPKMVYGNKPADGGALIIEDEDYEEFIKKDINSRKFIKPLLGAAEFLHNKKRWCIWLKGSNPKDIQKCPLIMERIKKCKATREASKAAGIRKFAQTPTLFAQITQPENKDYILIPRVSSERRRYVPMAFFTSETIVSDAVQIVPNASIYEFGVLTSNVHMSWMRAVCGRLKSDYRYSKDVVYNNFHWCNPTPEQKDKIAQTAQGILDARALYPNSSLADLYDELTMPPELRKAHTANDIAVMKAYGFNIKETSEESCVAELMRMYQKIVESRESEKKK